MAQPAHSKFKVYNVEGSMYIEAQPSENKRYKYAATPSEVRYSQCVTRISNDSLLYKRTGICNRGLLQILVRF